MNREIKFRQPIYSLKGEFKTFHYWGYIDGAFIYPAGFLNVKQKNNEKNKQQEQFTGLKDKNGKDIYEGDILRVTDKDNEFEHEYIGKVKYDSEICMFLVGNNPFETAFTKIKFEVIGNIHENPAQ